MLKHKRLRLQMLQAMYPNIQNELINFRMYVNKASRHPQFRTVTRIFRLLGLPISLSQLEGRLMDEETTLENY